jgi:electron transport complex protein RnfG
MTDDPNISNDPFMEPPEEKEAGSFRLIFTLGLAGFLSGLILASAYIYTKPMIEANKAAAIEKAIYQVLPGCVSFKSLELKDGVLSGFDAAAEKQRKKGEEPLLVYQGFGPEDAPIGFAIIGAEPGFQDIIAIMMGYDPVNQAIIGYEVLESKETPGLGDKIFKDGAFRKNFVSLLTEPEILFAKKGEKTRENEVEAITGATISSKAIIRLLNNSMDEWKQPIADYMDQDRSTLNDPQP